jgi:hypothetical protein
VKNPGKLLEINSGQQQERRLSVLNTTSQLVFWGLGRKNLKTRSCAKNYGTGLKNNCKDGPFDG